MTVAERLVYTKKENERLKRELDVREKAIEQIIEENEHLRATRVPRKNYSDLQVEHDQWKLVAAQRYRDWEKSEERYHKEHAIVINLDAELENKREELRQAREEVVSMGQELEHLRPLMVLYMKEKVE